MSQPNANTTDHQDEPQRAILLIPDVTPPGLTTYDAKDPDAEYPRSASCALRRVPRTFW